MKKEKEKKIDVMHLFTELNKFNDVVFTEQGHTYTVGGQEAISVTTFIGQFKETFDQISKSRTMILVSRELHNLTVCKKLMFFTGVELAQYGPTETILEQDGPAQELMKKQLRIISPKFEQAYKTSVKSVMS